MSITPKANITPEDVGLYFTDDGKKIFELIGCETEPYITMREITEDRVARPCLSRSEVR